MGVIRPFVRAIIYTDTDSIILERIWNFDIRYSSGFTSSTATFEFAIDKDDELMKKLKGQTDRGFIGILQANLLFQSLVSIGDVVEIQIRFSTTEIWETIFFGIITNISFSHSVSDRAVDLRISVSADSLFFHIISSDLSPFQTIFQADVDSEEFRVKILNKIPDMSNYFLRLLSGKEEKLIGLTYDLFTKFWDGLVNMVKDFGITIFSIPSSYNIGISNIKKDPLNAKSFLEVVKITYGDVEDFKDTTGMNVALNVLSSAFSLSQTNIGQFLASLFIDEDFNEVGEFLEVENRITKRKVIKLLHRVRPFLASELLKLSRDERNLIEIEAEKCLSLNTFTGIDDMHTFVKSDYSIALSQTGINNLGFMGVLNKFKQGKRTFPERVGFRTSEFVLRKTTGLLNIDVAEQKVKEIVENLIHKQIELAQKFFQPEGRDFVSSIFRKRDSLVYIFTRSVIYKFFHSYFLSGSIVVPYIPYLTLFKILKINLGSIKILGVVNSYNITFSVEEGIRTTINFDRGHILGTKDDIIYGIDTDRLATSFGSAIV